MPHKSGHVGQYIHVALLFLYRARNNISTVQIKEAKRVGNEVLGLSYKTLQVPTNHANYLRVILFTNPSARAGYDTRSIFKQSLTGWNSEFSFS